MKHIESNQTVRVWADGHQPLHWWIDAQCRRTPDATALRFESECMTYGELANLSDRMARKLARAGVAPGHQVVLWMPRSLELVVALLAVLKAGAAYVPLDMQLPSGRLQAMLQDINPRLLVCGPEVPPGIGDVQPMRCDLSALQASSSDDLLQLPEVSADWAAYAIFTSGSTGLPKAAVNSHRGIVNRLLWMQDVYRLTSADVVLQKTPYSFDVSVWEFFWPLMFGATLEIARPGGHLDPFYVGDLVRERGVTVLHFVPTVLRLFCGTLAPDWASGLRLMFCSGEHLPLDLMREVLTRWPTLGLHNLYGPTECAVDVTFWDCRANQSAEKVLIGRPVANTRVYVLDDQLEPVAPGDVGELFLAGIQVGGGYLNRPQLTAERFLPDPYVADHPGALGVSMYRTGDLGRWTLDGHLEYLGRTDFQVKLSGVRIELGEIESQLRAQEGCQDALVLKRTEGENEQLHGVLVLTAALAQQGSEERSAWIEAVRAALHDVLPAIMVPSRLHVIDVMPLTSSGKTDRRAVEAWLDARSAKKPDSDPSGRQWATPEQAWVAQAWERHLASAPTSVDDRFIALGGGSLLALKVAAELSRLSGLRVSPALPMMHATLGAQARALSSCLALGSGVPTRLPEQQSTLSASQQQLLLSGLLDETGAALLVQVPLVLAADQCLIEVRRAFESLLMRHPILRTCAWLEGEQWRTKVWDAVPSHWWQAQGHLDRIPQGLDWPRGLLEAINRPLPQEPIEPCRVDVWRVPDGRHLVVWTLHHFAVDEAATDLCLDELHRLLAGDALPTPASLESAAARQEVHLDHAGIQRVAGELLSTRAGLPPPFVHHLGASRECLVEFPLDLQRQIEALHAQEPHRFFPWLLAMFGVAIQQVWGEGYQHVLTPYSRRFTPALQAEVGYCLDVRFIRAGRLPGESAERHLERVAHEVLDGLAPDYQPIEKIAELLGRSSPECVRGLGAFCLTWRQFPGREMQMGAHRAELLVYPHLASKFGVTLHAARLRHGIQFSIEALVTAHEEGRVANLIEQFVRAVQAHLSTGLPWPQQGSPGTAPGAPDRERALDPHEGMVPVDPGLAALWRGILQLEADHVIVPDSHFFRSGGTSLGVIRLVAAFKARFGVSLSAGEFMQRPTLQSLQLRLKGMHVADVDASRSVERNGVLIFGAEHASRVIVLMPGYLGHAVGMARLATALLRDLGEDCVVWVPDLATLVEQVSVRDPRRPEGGDLVDALMTALRAALPSVQGRRIEAMMGYSMGGQLILELARRAGPAFGAAPVVLLDSYPSELWRRGLLGRKLRSASQRFWRAWSWQETRRPRDGERMEALDQANDSPISADTLALWAGLDDALSKRTASCPQATIHLIQAGDSLWYTALFRHRDTNGFLPQCFARFQVYRIPYEHLELPKAGASLVAGLLRGIVDSRE
jgi:amino acid adenylation domain-containing protein